MSQSSYTETSLRHITNHRTYLSHFQSSDKTRQSSDKTRHCDSVKMDQDDGYDYATKHIRIHYKSPQHTRDTHLLSAGKPQAINKTNGTSAKPSNFDGGLSGDVYTPLQGTSYFYGFSGLRQNPNGVTIILRYGDIQP